VKARMDYWANNNPALRKIIYAEMFAWDAAWSGVQLTRSAAQRAAIRAAFGNSVNEVAYRAGTRGVPVKFVPTYESWAGQPSYLISTHPSNTTTSRLGQANADSHPSAEGHTRIAGILWPHIKQELLARAG
jgi:hypothetical protein